MTMPRRIRSDHKNSYQMPPLREYNDLVRSVQGLDSHGAGMPGFQNQSFHAPKRGQQTRFKLVQLIDPVLAPCSQWFTQHAGGGSPLPPGSRVPDSYDKQAVTIPIRREPYYGWPYVFGGSLEEREIIRVSNPYNHKYFFAGMRFMVMLHEQSGEWLPIDSTPTPMAVKCPRDVNRVAADPDGDRFDIYTLDSGMVFVPVGKTVYCMCKFGAYQANKMALASWVPGAYQLHGIVSEKAEADSSGCWVISLAECADS